MATGEGSGLAVASGGAGGGGGRTGGEAEGELLPPELRQELIFLMKDVPAQLQKEYKISKKERQGNKLLCGACGKRFLNVKAASIHTENKDHQIRLKERRLEELLPGLSRMCPDPDFQALTALLTTTFTQHSATEQRQSRLRVAEELQHCLHEDGLLDVTVSVFGSSGSGFALRTSDINLNINLSGSTEKPSVIASCMNGVAKSLRKREELYKDVVEDYFSFNKIPRILFKHKQNELNCEIRVEAGNPAALCSLLRIYADIDVRCVQLAILFRLWANICRMDVQENGYYPAHMFVLMVIHFLQQVNVLPVLHEMHKKRAKKQETSALQGKNRPPGMEGKETKAATPQKLRGSEESNEGEGSGDEDDVVVFEESETSSSVCEDNDESERNAEGGGEGKQYEVDYLSDLAELRSRWQSTNDQSLGELWFRLLMYYTVEFKISEHAVSVRQKPALLRKSREWGETRLAVEDPLIPRSNLGRGSASQQVYNYLIGSLRLTTLYFSAYSGHSFYSTVDVHFSARELTLKCDDKTTTSINWTDAGSAVSGDQERAGCREEEGKEGLKGSIVHQDSSIVSVSSSVKTSTQSPEDLNSPVDLSFLSQLGSGQSSPQPVVDTHPDLEAGVVGKEVEVGKEGPQVTPPDNGSTDGLQHQLQDLEIAVECQGSGEVVDKEGSAQNTSSSTTPLSTTVSQGCTQGPLDSKKALRFAVEDFVFQPYPVSCLNCKKLKHTILECPELDVTSKYQELLPKHRPSGAVLKQISGCFNESMWFELPDQHDLQMRQLMLGSILEDIRILYPRARLEMFGSSANGFGSKHSDLDICLTIPGDDKESRGEIIEKIAKELKHKRWKYDRIYPITSARVPIVKLFMRQWEMQCDISLENKLALRNTKLLAAYTRIDGRVPELGCALKLMAKTCEMCDAATGSLSSYAYILVLLHYLQNVTPPVVPVLQQLKPTDVETEGHMIDNWNCYFYELDDLGTVWPGYHANTCTTGELWLGMLRYYTTEFDWNYNVVTIKQKEPLSKFDKWWMGKAMCIEDPFNLDHNLGAGVSNRMRMYILDRFMDTLRHHSLEQRWNNIRQLMDPAELKRGFRPPKFMRCNICGSRGHRAAECPKKGENMPQQDSHRPQQGPQTPRQSPHQPQQGPQQLRHLQPRQGSRQRIMQREAQEPRNKTNPQDRVVYTVKTPRRKERTPPGGQQPNQMLPHMYTNNYSLIPNNAVSSPPPHPSLFQTPAAAHNQLPLSPQQPFVPHLYAQSPPGMHGFPGSSPISRPHPGMGPAVGVPYSHSNYPLPHQMVTRPQHILPHTVGRSPPYRQYQQPPPLFPYPPGVGPTSTGPAPHTVGPSLQMHIGNPGLPNRHFSAPPTYSREAAHDSARKGQRGRRNRQKTQQNN